MEGPCREKVMGRLRGEARGVAVGAVCARLPPLVTLTELYAAAGGRYYVCPICFSTKQLDESALVANAELAGTVPLWQWIGDEEPPPSATEQRRAAWRARQRFRPLRFGY